MRTSLEGLLSGTRTCERKQHLWRCLLQFRFKMKTSKSWKLSGTFALYYSPLLLLSLLSILLCILLPIMRNFPLLSFQPLHFSTLHN